MFAMTSFGFAGGSKVAGIYVAIALCGLSTPGSAKTTCAVCPVTWSQLSALTFPSGLSLLLSLLQVLTFLILSDQEKRHWKQPFSEDKLEADCLQETAPWSPAERIARESHLKFNHKYMMYFAMCTDLTRECHGDNSEQLDVCGLTTSNSWTHDEWPMVKVHILNKGKHSLSCCSSVVKLFCGIRKFPCSMNVCFPATVKRKLQQLIWGGEKLSFSSALRFPRWQLELQPRTG